MIFFYCGIFWDIVNCCCCVCIYLIYIGKWIEIFNYIVVLIFLIIKICSFFFVESVLFSNVNNFLNVGI